MIEEWRKIEDYPNYSVSNLGRVRNDKTGRILAAHKWGELRTYLHVILYTGSHASRKSHSIHRLVAQAFVPNPDNKPEVNHLDGNGLNNCALNLEWTSRSENMIHAREVLHRGHLRKVIRLDDGQVFNTLTEAAQACGSNAYSGISHCLSGRRQTAFGYHWKYFTSEDANNEFYTPAPIDIVAPKKVIRVEDSQVFDSAREAAHSCGIKDVSFFLKYLNGKLRRPTIGGYHWKYMEIHK